MDGRRRGARGLLTPPIVLLSLPSLLLVLLLAAALAEKPHGKNIHRPDGECATCHSGDAATLRRDTDAAKAALVPDLEARCTPCHADEGPSHKTGIRPTRTVPATLPLAPDGTIGCATCHFMHGERNDFGDFLRIDNRRGGLCLSCHELSELQ